MTNPRFTPILCYHCKHSFIDDHYGVCCINIESDHYTRSWDLPITAIKECECFEERWGDIQ